MASRWSPLVPSPFWSDVVSDWLQARLSTGFDTSPSRLRGPIWRSGTSGNNFLLGSFGNDVLRGGPGDDILLGIGGHNQLFGEAGNDLLIGGLGRDRLDGGPGRNWLIGGPGADRFVLRADGRFDTIFDFQVGRDRLLLEGGLTPTQVVINQQGANTAIRYLGQSEPAAVLLNVEASQLQTDSFLTRGLLPNFDQLVIFGDSLSDPGNLFGLTNFFPLSPPYFEGKFSNGDIWVDYLAESLSLAPDSIQNFAIGGATTGQANGFDLLLTELTGIEWQLPGLLDQLDSYVAGLGGESANANGLYVVWAGANDLFNLPSDPEAIPSFLANSVQNVVSTISTLASVGADSFLVPNLPNLGLTPRSLQAGVSEQASFLSNLFNTSLADALDTLALDLDIDVVLVDLFAATTEITQQPQDFGFTNVTDPLLGQLPSLADPGFLWWDQQHPTTQAHSLLSEYFQTQLFDAGYLRHTDDELPIPVLAEPVLAGATPTIPPPADPLDLASVAPLDTFSLLYSASLSTSGIA